MTSLTNVLATPQSAMGELGPLVLWVQRTEMTLAMARAFIRRSDELQKRLGCQGAVIYVCDGATPPAAEVREALNPRSREGFLGVAVVTEGAGMMGTIVRTVVSGMALVQRERVPMRAFSAVPEAHAWFAAKPEARAHVPPLSALEAAVAELRARTTG